MPHSDQAIIQLFILIRNHKSANKLESHAAVTTRKTKHFSNVPIPACFIATTFALISLRNDLATMLASILVPLVESAIISDFLSDGVDDIFAKLFLYSDTVLLYNIYLAIVNTLGR